MDSWILALADDLTGALEVGAKFAARGLSARVTTDRSIATEADSSVVVIDTETRHCDAAEAAGVVRGVVNQALPFCPTLVYKKTDSTLRGHIGPELAALQEAVPDRDLVYVPAYPEMGRTVKNGHLLVWGTPVHQTAFATDLLNPIRESNIHSHLGGVSALVLDGDCPADVESAAQIVINGHPPRLAAGPAGLAGALAELVAGACQARPALPKCSRCLLVNGSLHPASAEQVAFAWSSGYFEDGWDYWTSDVAGSGLDRACDAGLQIRDRLASSRYDALIVFGGDTAFGIHRALGSPAFTSVGEIAVGVPMSHCAGLYWITKAGGFGPPDLLADIRKKLT